MSKKIKRLHYCVAVDNCHFVHLPDTTAGLKLHLDFLVPVFIFNANHFKSIIITNLNKIHGTIWE